MIKFKKVIVLCCVLAFVKFAKLSSDLNYSTESYVAVQNEQNQTRFDSNKLIFNQMESNQTDQNETDDQIDAKDLFKSFLLKKLDLNSIPTNLTDAKVPKLLLDLAELNSHEQNRIFLPHNSNTIRSHSIVNQNQKTPSKRNKSGYLVKFDLTFPAKETLNAGELRLYLNRSNKCSSRKQRITINQIVQSSRQVDENHFTSIAEESNLVYRQIDALVIKYDRHIDRPNWIQFDVLPAIKSWLQNASLNNGLLIKSFCVDRNEFSLNEAKFVDNFVISPSLDDSSPDESTDEMYENYKPLLLTYSNFHATTDLMADNFDQFMNKKKRHINSQIISSIRNNYANMDRMNGKTNDCGKHSMYIDFKEIGWQDFVISPAGFNAYRCYGQCSLTLTNGRNGNTSSIHTTNHLFFASSTNRTVLAACCVPIEFAPMAMIYRESARSSVLKVYENMIVTRCGCK